MTKRTLCGRANSAPIADQVTSPPWVWMWWDKHVVSILRRSADRTSVTHIPELSGFLLVEAFGVTQQD